MTVCAAGLDCHAFVEGVTYTANGGGPTIVTARIELSGQDQPLLLNRVIDLRPDGPRL